MYDYIDLLNGLQFDKYDPDDIPTLTGKIPEYMMIEYLQSSYELKFDINVILPNDLITFLMFIDQYPTTILSIDQIETDLIMFIDLNKLEINDYMMEMCKKYKLKSMYMYFHQRILALQQNRQYILSLEYI